MKPVILHDFCVVDLAIVPNFVADDLYAYQKKFDEWLFDRSNDHGYWVIDPHDGDWGLCYDDEAFIKWLNEYIIEDENEKAAILKNDIGLYYEKLELPKVYF